MNERHERRLTARFLRRGVAAFSGLVWIGVLMLSASIPNEAGAGGPQVGKASWYGPGFHGKKTASGERFDENALTAAHPRLPLGTKVRVTHLGNGKTVEVRINDRGPHGGGRIIDLSRAAARELAMSGSARVRIETLW